MFGYIAAALLGSLLTVRLIISPAVSYLCDRKRLRRFPQLHPLSGVSNIPYIMESLTGKRSQRLAALHQKHPIIRIGPNALSFGDHRAIKDIYGHSTKCTKDDMYAIISGSHYNVADVLDKEHHAQKRKVLSSAYALRNLENWDFKIADKIQRVVKHFDNCCTDPREAHGPKNTLQNATVDYRAWTNFFTMDAIADIGLSQSLGFTDRGDDDTISESMGGTQRTVRYREALHSGLIALSHTVWSYAFFPYLKQLTKLIPKYRKLWSVGDGYEGIVIHQGRVRLERYLDGEKLDDFFQALMETKDRTPHYLEWGEIIAELNVMLNAGSVSTAIAINNVMYCLLKNPEALAKLRRELDDALGSADVLVAPYDQVKHLPYLRACLDEAMRLNPPTPFNLPRKTPPEGTTIMGYFIPGNTSVSMSSYVAHRDVTIFPDPETFRPERWLGEEGKELQPYFLTFSAGARGCIGRNISYLEQYMITATMVHRYDFALPDPSWEQERYEHFNEIPGPLPLKVSRRVKCTA